jgi:hypothetical protein
MRAVAGQENVTVRIVPADEDLPVAPYHGFYVADERFVIVDLFNTSLLSRGRRTVKNYRRIFEAFERVATDVTPFLDRYQRIYARLLLPD